MNTVIQILRTAGIHPEGTSLPFNNRDGDVVTDFDGCLQQLEASPDEKVLGLWNALNQAYDDIKTPFSAALYFELAFRELI